MMVLILVLSVTAVYFFIREYKKEMREKQERDDKKKAEAKNESTG